MREIIHKYYSLADTNFRNWSMSNVSLLFNIVEKKANYDDDWQYLTCNSKGSHNEKM